MTNYRRLAFEHHGRECAECGATENIEVHHRDGDRTNNTPDNLLPLCVTHHEELHRSGLNDWEDELKPTEERSHIDDSKTTFGFDVTPETWSDWKETVPRTKSLDTRIVELIQADTENRVNGKP